MSNKQNNTYTTINNVVLEAALCSLKLGGVVPPNVLRVLTPSGRRARGSKGLWVSRPEGSRKREFLIQGGRVTRQRVK